MYFLIETTRILSPHIDPSPPQSTDISGFLQWAFNTGIMVALILAGVFFTIYGFWYMIAFKDGKKAELREKMYNIVLGIVIIISSYIILEFINPNLIKLDMFKNFGDKDSKIGAERDESANPTLPKKP